MASTRSAFGLGLLALLLCCLAPTLQGNRVTSVEVNARAELELRAKGTPADTVKQYCDSDGLKAMHGQVAEKPDEEEEATEKAEEEIVKTITKELESNNIDKVAKSIFSFYVCTRWAPDRVFWKLAEQELSMQMADAVIGDEEGEGSTIMAIADMYRHYQFVPLLCSENFEVYKEIDEFDHTYFHGFKKKVSEMAYWVKETKHGDVYKALKKIDKVFCGNKPMNSCDRGAMWESFLSFFGVPTAEEKQEKLADKLQNFADEDTEDFNDYKLRFPFHSFIAKPLGWTADVDEAPKAKERWLICFGMRVASELHRRPNGGHILTDQNNVGCHGWYKASDASDMLRRMVEMWKPPTCQLAIMGYQMKKEILSKFHEMNQRLFEALPSIVNDELQEQELNGEFNYEDQLLQPWEPQTYRDHKTHRTFVDDMLVRAVAKLKNRCVMLNDDGDCKEKDISEGTYGHVKIDDGKLKVLWSDYEESVPEESENLEILPLSWKAKKGFFGHVRDLVSGVSTIWDKAKELVDSLSVPKKKNLANLMFNSTSKWAVCPIKGDADLSELDLNLGVEDAAFQDFQRQAYKEWNKQEPKEDCVSPDETLGQGAHILPGGSKVCKTEELHENHVEAYTKSDYTKAKEKFACPIRPPLSTIDQLEIMKERKGLCYLHMTGRQERQYRWHYQGFFPARRQYDAKENPPREEFELVRLSKIPEDDEGIEGQVTFERWCSLEELRAQPRFCHLPKVHKDWSTLEEMAHDLAESLESSGDDQDTDAPTSIGATAVEESLGKEQDKLKKEPSLLKKFGRALLWVGEKTWDKIRGGYRLTVSSAKWAKVKLTPGVYGTSRIDAELEESLFGEDTAGNLLHSLSFQRSLGSNNQTSNAKNRLERYVVTYPCDSFDPAVHYAIKKKWSQIALRAIRESYKMFRRSTRGAFSAPTATLLMRGEATRYKNTRAVTVDVNWHAKAAMKWSEAPHVPGDICKKIDGNCEPDQFCDETFMSWISDGCKIRFDYIKSVAAGQWWPVQDSVLAHVVSPIVNSGDLDLSELSALKMTLHCAPKKLFPAEGPPPVGKDSLMECLQKGVETNAALKAKEPWKLYYPDEVIVMITFETIDQVECWTSSRGDNSDQRALCQKGGIHAGAKSGETVPIEYTHLVDPETGSRFGHDDDDSDVFTGVRKGAGFPKGVLSEVVVGPQDVLEAVEAIVRSHGR